MSPYTLHRDQRWWAKPDAFDPDRWLSTTKPHAPRACLPFGAGPRFCPGTMLGTVHLVTFAVVMACDYELDLPRLDDVQAQPDALLTPAGLHGSWHRRRPKSTYVD